MATSMPRASSCGYFPSRRSASWTSSASRARRRSRSWARLYQRLEGAVLALVAELHARGVERDRVLGELRRRREDELGLGIDEALDQPRRRDAVDMRPRPRDPAPPAKLGEIERRARFAAGGFGTSGAHGDGLLETPDLRAAGGVEEVDVADTLMVLGQARQLVPHAGTGGGGLALEALEQLAVARGELPVLPVARLVEEPQHVVRRHVLDLLDPNEGGVSALPLDLLGEPLEVLVPLRHVRQQVGRPLQRHRAEGPQAAPHAHAQARRGGREPDQQEEERVVHVSRCNTSCIYLSSAVCFAQK